MHVLKTSSHPQANTGNRNTKFLQANKISMATGSFKHFDICTQGKYSSNN